jgi:hypothetical protein
VSRHREVQREILPLPDRPFTNAITYDAGDPDTLFPSIEALRPPDGASSVLVILLDDVGGNEFSGRIDWAQMAMARP